jgi:hypothetical protein
VDRFTLKQPEQNLAMGPFYDGSEARVFGHKLEQVPSANVIGEWSHKSWIVGWHEADQGMCAEQYSDSPGGPGVV